MYPGTALRTGDPRVDLVKLCQSKLNEILCDDLKVDGDFGRKTESSVKLLQTRRGLTADGAIGPITWAHLFGLEPSILKVPETALLGGVLQIALGETGVREHGRNRGPAVEKYLAAVNKPPGLAWCMAYVCWCCQEGAKARRVENPAVMTAGVHRHWKKAPDEVKVEPSAATDDLRNIKPGMIFLIDHGHGKGHTGIVVLAEPGGLRTIEGNTNIKGSRDGDGVYPRVRRYAEINLGFLDYSRINARPLAT